MICRAGEHYDVRRNADGDLIVALACKSCAFVVRREDVSGVNAPGWTGGASGSARYNRMRAKMVRHWHRVHAPMWSDP